jgi:hypothetical protein
MSFSLNERVAFSTSLQHRITERSKLDGHKILRSDANAATLFLSTSYLLNRWTTFSVSLGIGINEDAPDFTLEARIPWRLPFSMKFPKLGSSGMGRGLQKLASGSFLRWLSGRGSSDAPEVLIQ